MIIQKTCAPSSLFSGERFSVTYRIYGNEKASRAKAEDICIEQTIEFPADLVATRRTGTLFRGLLLSELLTSLSGNPSTPSTS